MIRINLLPLKEARRAFGRRQQVSMLALSLSVTLLLMIIPYIFQGRTLAHLDQEIDQLSGEIAKLEAQAREVRDLEKKRADLQAKLKIIEDLKQKRVGPVRILADLSVATPEKLWLVDFSDNNSLTTITSLALDNQTIALLDRKSTRLNSSHRL